MHHRLNLIGQRFNRWLVVECVRLPGRPGRMWRCKCDCGSEGFVNSHYLIRAKSRSCGCLAAEESKQRFSLPAGVAALNAVVARYRASARKRKITWELPHEVALRLITSPCTYCGDSPQQAFTISNGSSACVYTGIDRADNSVGYTVENAVSCCYRCNYAKRESSRDVFEAWLTRAGKFQLAKKGHV